MSFVLTALSWHCCIFEHNISCLSTWATWQHNWHNWPEADLVIQNLIFLVYCWNSKLSLVFKLYLSIVSLRRVQTGWKYVLPIETWLVSVAVPPRCWWHLDSVWGVSKDGQHCFQLLPTLIAQLCMSKKEESMYGKIYLDMKSSPGPTWFLGLVQIR